MQPHYSVFEDVEGRHTHSMNGNYCARDTVCETTIYLSKDTVFRLFMEGHLRTDFGNIWLESLQTYRH